jgi:putative phosphoribosyl transferase
VTIGPHRLAGVLAFPDVAKALVIIGHRSGSGRFGARNRQTADIFADSGFATLLFDLLTEAEANDRRSVFDVPLLGARMVEAIDWAAADPSTLGLPVGIFGVSAGAPAAIIAAACRPVAVWAIVLRGGTPDVAGLALGAVRAPTLMIVGSEDRQLRNRNIYAMKAMQCMTSLTVAPGAGRLFEEAGTLDQTHAAAKVWYDNYLRIRRACFADRATAGRALASRIFSHAP